MLTAAAPATGRGHGRGVHPRRRFGRRRRAHGFHVAYAAPPLNEAQGAPSIGLARALRDALRAAGFAPANYLRSDGLAPRADLARLNLSTRPSALVECGNMRDEREAAVLSSPAGRQRYAYAITAAILGYLGRRTGARTR